MAKRGMNGQQAHDSAVSELAENYQSDGWNVWADVDGFPTPPSVRGRIPDVLARDASSRVIIEVETDPTDDAAQHDKFRAEAAADPDCQFIAYLADITGELQKRIT